MKSALDSDEGMYGASLLCPSVRVSLDLSISLLGSSQLPSFLPPSLPPLFVFSGPLRSSSSPGFVPLFALPSKARERAVGWLVRERGGEGRGEEGTDDGAG